MNQSRPKQVSARIGGHIVADALAVHGVDTIFGVPGESYLAVLDGLYPHRDQIRYVICRQEGGAAFMADAYAKLTGKPGVVMVTRGPGATNAAVGIHTAMQDSTPMVVLVGQVGTDCLDREAFQEIDYRRMLGQCAKWVAQIDRADRIPEYMARAFQVATSGRMGPVVLALPEDVLTTEAIVGDTRCHVPVRPSPSQAQMTRLQEMLAGASHPIVIAGGSGWSVEACEQLRVFAENTGMPIACAFRRQDLLDNHHPHYVGDVGIGINPRLAERIRHADLVLAVGTRLSEMVTSAYTLLSPPSPVQTLVHVHPDAGELGKVYQADLMINAGLPEMAAALANLRIDGARWRDQLQAARSDYEQWQQRPGLFDRPGLDRLDLWQVVRTLQTALPADTILTNGAGNFATWAHRFWRYGGLRTQLAPTSGAMGYGIPAAIGAKIAAPERTVVCFAGDGDFLMNAQEFATAAQYDAGVLVIVFNNNMYGTIRMHQEREYPGRVIGTPLANPDFSDYSKAFGGFGTVVEETAQFDAALEDALAFIGRHHRPAVIELRVDAQVITPARTLDEIAGRA
ncbi:MAG: thiamine pyrophosphate-binding protein [Burkholderiaceae bacterium]|nr:thiamine pyrophosphate-binding protein [Burkholderiaceae bacterium]